MRLILYQQANGTKHVYCVQIQIPGIIMRIRRPEKLKLEQQTFEKSDSVTLFYHDRPASVLYYVCIVCMYIKYYMYACTKTTI